MHLNIASLNKHFEDLYNLISLINFHFDIIGVSEHKINQANSNSNDYNIPGYNFCFDLTETSHGGTGFYISKKLTFQKRADLNIYSTGKLESTFIELDFTDKKT